MTRHRTMQTHFVLLKLWLYVCGRSSIYGQLIGKGIVGAVAEGRVLGLLAHAHAGRLGFCSGVPHRLEGCPVVTITVTPRLIFASTASAPPVRLPLLQVHHHCTPAPHDRRLFRRQQRLHIRQEFFGIFDGCGEFLSTVYAWKSLRALDSPKNCSPKKSYRCKSHRCTVEYNLDQFQGQNFIIATS